MPLCGACPDSAGETGAIEEEEPAEEGVRDHRRGREEEEPAEEGDEEPAEEGGEEEEPAEEGDEEPVEEGAGKETNRTRPKRVVRDLLKGEARKSPLKKEARKEGTRARPKRVVKSPQKRRRGRGEPVGCSPDDPGFGLPVEDSPSYGGQDLQPHSDCPRGSGVSTLSGWQSDAVTVPKLGDFPSGRQSDHAAHGP